MHENSMYLLLILYKCPIPTCPRVIVLYSKSYKITVSPLSSEQNLYGQQVTWPEIQCSKCGVSLKTMGSLCFWVKGVRNLGASPTIKKTLPILDAYASVLLSVVCHYTK